MSKDEQGALKRSLGRSRERFLSLPELDELLDRGPADLWAHYDPRSSLYAGDVPHIAIITPSVIIPPKFLRWVAKPWHSQHCSRRGRR